MHNGASVLSFDDWRVLSSYTLEEVLPKFRRSPMVGNCSNRIVEAMHGRGFVAPSERERRLLGQLLHKAERFRDGLDIAAREDVVKTRRSWVVSARQSLAEEFKDRPTIPDFFSQSNQEWAFAANEVCPDAINIARTEYERDIEYLSFLRQKL